MTDSHAAAPSGEFEEVEETEYFEEVIEDDDDEEVEIVEEIVYVSDEDAESYEEEYVEEEIISDGEDEQQQNQGAGAPVVDTSANAAPPASTLTTAPAGTTTKTTTTTIKKSAAETGEITITADGKKVKKIKKKVARKSHMASLGNRIGAFVRSRSRGRLRKDGEKDNDDDSDDERDKRPSGSARGRGRTRNRGAEDDDNNNNNNNAPHDTPNDESAAPPLSAPPASSPPATPTKGERSHTPVRVVSSGKKPTLVSPLAIFGRGKSKKDMGAADSSAEGSGLQKPDEPRLGSKARTVVRLSRNNSSSSKDQPAATKQTSVVSSTTTTTVTTTSVATATQDNGVTKTVTKTVAVQPPVTVTKVEESLMPEYVQTNEPIEYSFSNSNSANNQVYYTNKLERKNLDWQKPEWAQKPVLKSTPKKEGGTIGPRISAEDKQIGWEKPAWATQNVLKSTGRGEALKKGADIALPITSSTARK